MFPPPALKCTVRVAIEGAQATMLAQHFPSIERQSAERHWRFVPPLDRVGDATLLVVDLTRGMTDALRRALFVAHHTGAPLVAALILAHRGDMRFERSLRVELCSLDIDGDAVEMLWAPTINDAREALLEALDVAVPRRQWVDPRDEALLLPIEDTFNIRGGTVLTGRVAQGRVSAGDNVEIVGFGPTRGVSVAGVEVFRKVVDAAERGQNVGVRLTGTERANTPGGAVLATPGSIQSADEFACRVRWVSADDRQVPRTLLWVWAGFVEVSLREDSEGGCVAATALPIALRAGERFTLRARHLLLGVVEVT